MLNRLATELFGEKGDPTEFYSKGQSQQIFRRGDNYILALKLPFVSQDEVKLMQTGDDLIIEIGWHRRAIVLPTALARCNAVDAVFVGDTLEVTFVVPKVTIAAPTTTSSGSHSSTVKGKK
jgi:HSP20 family molecular chaperone IbpA